jgi:hypothetical protein
LVACVVACVRVCVCNEGWWWWWWWSGAQACTRQLPAPLQQQALVSPAPPHL